MECICNYCGKSEQDQLIVWNVCLECQKRPDLPTFGKEIKKNSENKMRTCLYCDEHKPESFFCDCGKCLDCCDNSAHRTPCTAEKNPTVTTERITT